MKTLSLLASLARLIDGWGRLKTGRFQADSSLDLFSVNGGDLR